MKEKETVRELEHRWFESDISCSMKEYIELFKREYPEYLECWYTIIELGKLIDEFEEYLPDLLKELEEEEDMWEPDAFENLGMSIWDFI